MRRLELDVGGRFDFGRSFGDGAERQPAPARHVHDRAALGGALRCRHAPARRRGGDQHFPRGCAGAAQIVLRRRDRAAGAGRGIAPGLIAAQIFRCRDEFRLDRPPVAFELFRHQHGEPRQGPLPHFHVRDSDRHGVVGPDDHPASNIETMARGARRSVGRRGKRNCNAERQAATGDARAHEKGTAIEFAAGRHELPLISQRDSAELWRRIKMRNRPNRMII